MTEDRRRQILTKRFVNLLEEYERVNQEISISTDSTHILRLERESQRLSRQVEALQEEINALPAPKPSTQNPQQEFPFTNRHDELQLLLSSYAPAYHLIDAPAGYGKSSLLNRLKEQFSEQGWAAAYISVNPKSSLTTISQEIADAIAVDHRFEINPRLPAATRLGSVLNLFWQTKGEGEKKGIVFLIDIEPTTPLSLVQKIQEDWIPYISESLKSLEFFRKNHNPFRVVIAGRYLTSTNTAAPAYPTKIMRLSTFTYEVVRDSTQQYLQGFAAETINDLTAHLFYLTGGHPGCVTEALQIYRTTLLPPDVFIQQQSGQIWEEVVCGYVDDVWATISEHSEVLDKLSLFRYMDYVVLQAFVQQYSLGVDAYQLSDLLTGRYLLDWDGRFLKDDIIRRLLAIKLRQSGAEFVAHSQQAQEIYKQYITSQMTMGPERWTIEYLFTILHGNSQEIHDAAFRENLSRQFFERDVPEALSLLVEGRNIPRRQWRAEKEAICRMLQQDWEFQFTVNYYLRNSHYSNEPYQQLQQSITRFFDTP